MDNSKWAFIRRECFGQSVSRGARDILIFNAGEVIPVIEEHVQEFARAGDIITETADGEKRFVSKQWANVMDGYSPDNDFMRLEDAADVVEVGMRLFLKGKSVSNLPNNSRHVFDVAAGVVEDHFVNTVFGDE